MKSGRRPGGPPQQEERVVGDADERRGEHADERLVVVAVLEQAQVPEDVDDLLLAEVAAAGRPVGRDSRAAQLLLVPLGVGAGREQEDDLAGRRGAALDQLAHAPRDVLRLRAAPVRLRVRIARLVGDEELDRLPEDGIGEVAGGRERLEVVAEVAVEEMVDGGEHLGAGAVVVREHQSAALGVPALPEDPDVGVPEAVDRLELVPDEEEVAFAQRTGEEVDQVALKAVRVLELVHHDRAEAERLLVADLGVAAQQLPGLELEVLEVER